MLWTLQVLAALVYGASGVMKVFLLDDVRGDVASFGKVGSIIMSAVLGLVMAFIAYGRLAIRPIA